MLQQTRSTQNPEAQSLPASQDAPFGLGPQRSFLHFSPAAHPAFVLMSQVVAQVFVSESQVYGEQILSIACEHCPLPSQVRTFAT